MQAPGGSRNSCSARTRCCAACARTRRGNRDRLSSCARRRRRPRHRRPGREAPSRRRRRSRRPRRLSGYDRQSARLRFQQSHSECLVERRPDADVGRGQPIGNRQQRRARRARSPARRPAGARPRPLFGPRHRRSPPTTRADRVAAPARRPAAGTRRACRRSASSRRRSNAIGPPYARRGWRKASRHRQTA